MWYTVIDDHGRYSRAPGNGEQAFLIHFRNGKAREDKVVETAK
jgi:hypothetical protein